MYIHVHMMTDKLLLQGVWGGGGIAVAPGGWMTPPVAGGGVVRGGADYGDGVGLETWP
jgi:hypothetical protein